MFLDHLRKYRQIILIVIAMWLGLTAQYLFTGEIFTHQINSNTWVWLPKYSAAVILLFLCFGVSAWAFLPREQNEKETVAPAPLFPTTRGRRLWLGVAGISYLLSLAIYSSAGETIWVRVLWLAAIAFLLLPFWMQTWGKRNENPVSSREWILLGALVLVGFGLRYWKLTEIPSHVDNDIALMGTFAKELIASGNYNWIGYSNSEHLLSYDQFQAWGMRLFGENHYGIVMHSVVLGTLSLGLIFLLGREIGGSMTGFMAAGLLTISYTHIHFSRILFGNSSSFAALLVVYAILRGIRTRQTLWFALAGTFSGWGLLLYDSSRVIPLMIVSIAAWQWLWHRSLFKSMYKDWLTLAAGALLSFGPMLAYAILNFSAFAGRANAVVLWTEGVWEHELASYQTDNPLVVLLYQTWRTFLTLHITGDASPHFAFQRPMVSSITALFFTLGLSYILLRIKNIKYFAIFSWFLLTFIMGGVLTADPPYWPHLNIALPAIMLAAAIAIERLAEILKKTQGRVGYMVFTWVMLGVIVVTGINNWQVYYDYVKNNAGNRIRVARYLSSLPTSYHVYLVSEFPWHEYAFRFFSQGMEGENLPAETLAQTPPAIQDPSVFILFRHPELVPVLQGLYPDGILENHYDFNNLVSFISYRVVPSTTDVPPQPDETSQLSSNGWMLIFLFIVAWVGYVAHAHYSAQEAAENKRE